GTHHHGQRGARARRGIERDRGNRDRADRKHTDTQPQQRRERTGGRRGHKYRRRRHSQQQALDRLTERRQSGRSHHRAPPRHRPGHTDTHTYPHGNRHHHPTSHTHPHHHADTHPDHDHHHHRNTHTDTHTHPHHHADTHSPADTGQLHQPGVRHIGSKRRVEHERLLRTQQHVECFRLQRAGNALRMRIQQLVRHRDHGQFKGRRRGEDVPERPQGLQRARDQLLLKYHEQFLGDESACGDL